MSTWCILSSFSKIANRSISSAGSVETSKHKSKLKTKYLNVSITTTKQLMLITMVGSGCQYELLPFFSSWGFAYYVGALSSMLELGLCLVCWVFVSIA